VVVGGGITGITTAYLLSKEGKKVVLVEDGELLSGETGRTTAHIMPALDDRWTELISLHGKENARLIADSNVAAINLIEHIVSTEKIDCEFERLDGYLFLSPSDRQGKGVEFLRTEFDAAKECNQQVEMVDFIPLKTDNGPAIKFRNQGQFNPVKYLNALAKICTNNGVLIFTNTHVSNVTDGKPAVCETSSGHKITSEAVVMATNVPVNDRVTMFTKLEPYRTYVIAATIPKGSVPRALYWDTEDPYHYARVTSDNSTTHELLIVGGEDHLVGQSHNFDERFNALFTWTKKNFPMVGEVVSKWSGQIIEPVDGIPFSGRNPGDHNNVFIHTGDSGTGITNGTMASILITDLISNRKNRWEELYSPSRQMTSTITEYLTHNAKVQFQYKEWVTGSDVKDIEDIPCGHGAVMRKGLTKEAVYKDENGNVFKCSAVCPHLGAIVNWNSTEKSWDCPAHGSRFDPYGRVLNGPANKNLTPHELKETGSDPHKVSAPSVILSLDVN